MVERRPDMVLDRGPQIAHPVNDDFSAGELSDRWESVAGEPGTVSLDGSHDPGIYDLETRPGWLLLSPGHDAPVRLRQAYGLQDGESVVVALSYATTLMGESGLTDGGLDFGITLNRSTTGSGQGTGVTIHIDDEVDGWRVWSGAGISAGSALPLNTDTLAIGRQNYLRIHRSGSNYLTSWSYDGAVWVPFGSYNVGNAPTQLWLWAAYDGLESDPGVLPVLAVNWLRIGGAGYDPWQAAPEEPVNILATAVASDEVHVTWDDVDEAVEYDLRWSLDDDDWTEELDVASPFEHTGLDPETLYYYQVRAVFSGGPGEWSASASVTTPESETGPYKQMTFEGGSTTGEFGGDSVTAGPRPRVISSNTIRGDYSMEAFTTGIAQVGYITANTTADEQYGAFYLRPDNQITGGTITLMSMRSASSFIFEIIQRNSSSNGLVARLGSSDAGIAAPELEDGVTYLVQYHYRRSSGSNDGLVWFAMAPAGMTPVVYANEAHNVTTAIAGIRFGHGNSATTSTANKSYIFDDIFLSEFQIPELPPLVLPVPETPENLYAEAVSHNEIAVVWDSTDFATSYDLRWSLDDDDWTVIPDVGEPYQHTARDPETTYYYQVRAVNESGASDWSESVSAATLPMPVIDLSARSGVVTGSRISIAIQSMQPVAARSGIVAGSRIAITAEAAGEVLAAVRGGIVAGARISVKVERPVAIRAGIEVGARAAPRHDVEGDVGIRGGVEVGSRIAVKVEVPVRIRAGVAVGSRQAFQFHRTVRIRSGVIVGSRDAYTGPGTGVVAEGAAFSPNAIREGDSFNVYLPWAGIEGLMALVQVQSRSISDSQAEQDLTLQAIPQPDPRLVPGMAGGGRPGLRPERSDVARRQARQAREIDRLERNRN